AGPPPIRGVSRVHRPESPFDEGAPVRNHLSRRQWLAATTLTGAAAVLPATTPAADPPKEPFRYSFNTSTIRGQKVPVADEVEIAAKAGYHCFEPRINELDQHVKDGKSLKDLGKLIRDKGMTVESAIGFAQWIVDDETQRKKGLEEARRNMDMVQQIGGKRIAAPPTGATDQANLNLMKAAERYRALCDIGASIGVIPQVEV